MCPPVSREHAARVKFIVRYLMGSMIGFLQYKVCSEVFAVTLCIQNWCVEHARTCVCSDKANLAASRTLARFVSR